MSVFVREGMKWALESLERMTAYRGFGFYQTPFRCRTFVLFSMEGPERSVLVTLGKNGGYRYMRYFLEGIEVKRKFPIERFCSFDLKNFMEGKWLEEWGKVLGKGSGFPDPFIVVGTTLATRLPVSTI